MSARASVIPSAARNLALFDANQAAKGDNGLGWPSRVIPSGARNLALFDANQAAKGDNGLGWPSRVIPSGARNLALAWRVSRLMGQKE
jgi:hypothetical protein